MMLKPLMLPAMPLALGSCCIDLGKSGERPLFTIAFARIGSD
jgi:hypothetical protein